MPESAGIGPSREQVPGHSVSNFEETVAPLTEGNLLLPHPFDLASAAALARNTDKGDPAERMFEFDARRRPHFRVYVAASFPDEPDVGERVIADTTLHGVQPLEALLDQILEEIAAQQP